MTRRRKRADAQGFWVPIHRGGWEEATDGLGPWARLLLLEVLLAADHRTDQVDGGNVTWCAEALGVNRRAAKDALEELEARGLVTVELHRGSRRGSITVHPGCAVARSYELAGRASVHSQDQGAGPVDNRPEQASGRAVARGDGGASRALARELRAVPRGQDPRSLPVPACEEENPPPPSSTQHELPVGLDEDEDPHDDPRVRAAIEHEVTRRETARTGPPLAVASRWRAKVRAQLVDEHGPALEAEAARDPGAGPDELWHRATRTEPVGAGRPAVVLGCDDCDHGWIDQPGPGPRTVAPCPRCLPNQANRLPDPADGLLPAGTR